MTTEQVPIVPGDTQLDEAVPSNSRESVGTAINARLKDNGIRPVIYRAHSDPQSRARARATPRPPRFTLHLCLYHPRCDPLPRLTHPPLACALQSSSIPPSSLSLLAYSFFRSLSQAAHPPGTDICLPSSLTTMIVLSVLSGCVRRRRAATTATD